MIFMYVARWTVCDMQEPATDPRRVGGEVATKENSVASSATQDRNEKRRCAGLMITTALGRHERDMPALQVLIATQHGYEYSVLGAGCPKGDVHLFAGK